MRKDFANSNLSNSSFAGMSLPGCDFSCSNLFNADFSNANLQEANFSYCNLFNANFTGANTKEANFTGSNLGMARYSASSASGNNPSDTEEFCDEFKQIPLGESKYENNVWGKKFLKAGESYKQCLRRRYISGNPQLGWKWSWPDRFEKNVYAYPEVIFGQKPWGGSTTTAQLPKALNQLKSVELKYEIEQAVSSGGAYNLAPEIWITDTGTSVQKENITAELMFWMDYKISQPAGSQVDMIDVGGIKYDVFRKDDMGKNDMGGPSVPIWHYLAFRSQTPGVLSANLPIHKFIQYAIDKEIVKPSHFLASIELGNEISSGRGETWVKDFQVNIQLQ